MLTNGSTEVPFGEGEDPEGTVPALSRTPPASSNRRGESQSISRVVDPISPQEPPAHHPQLDAVVPVLIHLDHFPSSWLPSHKVAPFPSAESLLRTVSFTPS